MITLARVQAEAAKAVAEMGRDFVYNEGGGYCFYRIAKVGEKKNYGPGGDTIKLGDPKLETPCIIGRILESLHINDNYIRGCQTSVSGLFGAGGMYHGTFSDAAVNYMYLLQRNQDNTEGRPWGHCYDAAEARVINGEIR